MFDSKQWLGVTFFEPASGSNKDFRSTLCKRSLAATASERLHPTSLELNLCDNRHILAINSYLQSQYGPGTSSQKRQKIFDYAQEDLFGRSREEPKREDLRRSIDPEISTEKSAAQ
jgi:hypothetical protein